MKLNKKGASLISLALCAVAVFFVVTALAVATNNSAIFRVNQIAKEQNKSIESSEYNKVYTLAEVTNIAKQAYADNYLSFYDNAVDLIGFKKLVIKQIMNTVPELQLDDYTIVVTPDGVIVE